MTLRVTPGGERAIEGGKVLANACHSHQVRAPGVVDVEGDPGGEGAVDGDEVVVEPVVLVAAGAEVLIRAQEDVVHRADVRLHAQA